MYLRILSFVLSVTRLKNLANFANGYLMTLNIRVRTKPTLVSTKSPSSLIIS